MGQSSLLDSRFLGSVDYFWFGLTRDLTTSEFHWYDGAPQGNLNIGSIRYDGTGGDKNQNCAALTYSHAVGDYVIEVERCSQQLYTFCQVQSGKLRQTLSMFLSFSCYLRWHIDAIRNFKQFLKIQLG